MPKRVCIAIDFDYDQDFPDDLMDIVQVSQVYTNLPDDAAHEQASFLLTDSPWRDTFAVAIANALTGATTQFGSSDN